MSSLILDNETNIDLREFITTSLIPDIADYFISVLDKKQLRNIDNYINTDNFKLLYNIQEDQILDSYTILVDAMNALTFSAKGKQSYQIYINPNIRIANTNLTYDQFITFVDQGNLQINPYPVWSETLQYFAEESPLLYQFYKEE